MVSCPWLRIEMGIRFYRNKCRPQSGGSWDCLQFVPHRLSANHRASPSVGRACRAVLMLTAILRASVIRWNSPKVLERNQSSRMRIGFVLSGLQNKFSGTAQAWQSAEATDRKCFNRPSRHDTTLTPPGSLRDSTSQAVIFLFSVLDRYQQRWYS